MGTMVSNERKNRARSMVVEPMAGVGVNGKRAWYGYGDNMEREKVMGERKIWKLGLEER